jgi:hypothetical protein
MPLQDEKTESSSSWKEREVTWKDVTDGLDILCLIVSYVNVIMSTPWKVCPNKSPESVHLSIVFSIVKC